MAADSDVLTYKSSADRLHVWDSGAEMRAHKASRGKSYRAQVIETLWMMAYGVVCMAAGYLAAVKL